MSRRKRDRRKRQRFHRNTAAVAISVLLVAIAFVLLGGALTASALVTDWLKDLPDYSSKDAFKIAQPTHIYSADGKLLARLYLEDRTVVPYSKMATDLINATVAVEDERFYLHQGVDWRGIARAVVMNVLSPEGRPEGASTITQQYIRNTILKAEKTDITVARKVREAYLALELEKRISKEEILALYLNTVYYGQGAHGIEAASQVFFSKHASQLTLPQAALLAGLVQQPSRLDPFVNPDGALERRAVVLERMLANGYIDQQQFDEASAAPLKLKRSDRPESGIYQAPYFVAYVKKLLQEKYSSAEVFKGGLRVYTTLDTRMQKYAESAVKDQLGEPDDPDTALVSIDPRTGQIKAMYGGRDYNQNKFNLATQGRRQPGSSFKTFVLVTALNQGVAPWVYIDSSSPAFIPTKPEAWMVSNSEGSGRGLVSLENATRHSINTVFARLIWAIGAKNVVKMAHRMGITSYLPAYPSIALGSSNVTPLEMASAYGTLATGGVHYKPYAISRVVDSAGKQIFKAKPSGTRAVSPAVAGEATDILEGVISGGTGTRADIDRPAAGKTGTSQNYRDAWFVGYTPQLVTSVWVGYYKAETPMRSVKGRRGFGGTLAAPIWRAFMEPALAGVKVADFPDHERPEYSNKYKFQSGTPVASVVGMTADAAKDKLEGSDLRCTVEYVDSTRPRGTVVAQSPAGGERAAPGSTVVLQVSKGAPATPAKPPSKEKPPPPEEPPVEPPPSDDTSPPPGN